MSLKSLIQIIILIFIFVILGGVYFKYFGEINTFTDQSKKINNQENIITETTKNNEQKEIKFNNIVKENKSNEMINQNIEKINLEPKKTDINLDEDNINLEEKNNINTNLVKDVEYITTDNNGNIYKIIAKSGKTNKNNKNKLDLINVIGEVSSDQRSPINISSKYAEYNSITTASKFFDGVIIKFEDKKITCENFEINMDTNIAIAYLNVVVTDPKTTIKASKIAFNIETKEIEINPDNNNNDKVRINTKQ